MYHGTLFFFFLNFNEEQLTLFLDDLEVQKCAHAQSKFSRFALFKTIKKISFNFIEM